MTNLDDLPRSRYRVTFDLVMDDSDHWWETHKRLAQHIAMKLLDALKGARAEMTGDISITRLPDGWRKP